MFPWGNTRNTGNDESPYRAGDGIYSGECRGTVVSVDIEAGTISVEWKDGDGAITYPADASYFRKAMPWE